MKSLLAISLLLCFCLSAMAVPKHSLAADHPPRPKPMIQHPPTPKRPPAKRANRTFKKPSPVKRSVAQPHAKVNPPRPKPPTPKPKPSIPHRAEPAIKESGTIQLVPDQENESTGTDLPPPSQP
jgi:hypothetical protein